MDTRESVVLHHLPTVHLIAGMYARKFSYHVAQDELVQVGAIGLLQAYDRYDPTRGEFWLFARHRVIGAMLEFARGQETWTGIRALRSKVKRINEAKDTLSQSLNREPSTKEIADYVKIKLEEVESLKANEQDIGPNPRPVPLGSASESPLESYLKAERLTNVLDALARLTEKQRSLLFAIYFQEVSQADISRELGCDQSNLSHMRKTAFKTLRHRLRDYNGIRV